MQTIYFFIIQIITGCHTANWKCRRCNDSAVNIAVAEADIPRLLAVDQWDPYAGEKMWEYI